MVIPFPVLLTLDSFRSGREAVTAALGRCCRKKILGGSLSNIDPKLASKAQVRFETSTPMIRLLPLSRMPRTFSTASAKTCREQVQQILKKIAPSFNHAVRAGEQRTRHGGSVQLQSTVGEGSSVNFLRSENGNYGTGNKPGFPPR
jgi:hypothetical protein